MLRQRRDPKDAEGRANKRLAKNICAWGKNLLDYHVSRNQVFHSKGDYLWAMLLCLSLNRRSMFRLTDLVATHGLFAFLPFILTSFLAHHSLLFVDVFAGFFPGTGIIATTRKLAPALAGVGSAAVLFAFYQLHRDFGDLSLLTAHLIHVGRMTTASEPACAWPTYPNINGHKAPPSCLSLRVAFAACNLNASAVNYTAFPPLPVHCIRHALYHSGGFDGRLMVISLFLLAFFLALTLFNVRKFTRTIRFLILPLLLLEAAVLLTAGLQFRLDTNSETCDYWADLGRMLSWKVASGSAAKFTVWLQAAFVALDMMAAGTGIVTGLSRRMAQGQLYHHSNLTVTIIGVTVHVFAAFLYILVSPRVMAPGADYPASPFIRLYSWAWVLFASDTMANTWLKLTGIFIVGASVGLCFTSRIFYIVDILRNAISEYASRFPSFSEEYIDDLRAQLAPALIGLVWALGTVRFAAPSGPIMDEWVRSSQGEDIGRLLVSAALVAVFYLLYRERRMAKDLFLVTKNEHFGRFGLARILRLIAVLGVYPLLLVLMFIGYLVAAARDQEHMFRADVDRLKESLKLNSSFATPSFLPHPHPSRLRQEWVGKAFKGIYCAIPLVPLVGQLLWDLGATLHRHDNLRDRFVANREWGPSEIRFWELDKRYKHLFYDYGGMLDEEREELLGALRKARGRQETTPPISRPATKTKKDV